MSWTYVPKSGQEDKPKYLREVEKVFYDVTNLEEVNNIRQRDGKPPIASLKGYCWSPGCSCSDPKPLPICGLFCCYDETNVKKDALNELFGI